MTCKLLSTINLKHLRPLQGRNNKDYKVKDVHVEKLLLPYNHKNVGNI